jgi:hypothetical protein
LPSWSPLSSAGGIFTTNIYSLLNAELKSRCLPVGIKETSLSSTRFSQLVPAPTTRGALNVLFRAPQRSASKLYSTAHNPNSTQLSSMLRPLLILAQFIAQTIFTFYAGSSIATTTRYPAQNPLAIYFYLLHLDTTDDRYTAPCYNVDSLHLLAVFYGKTMLRCQEPKFVLPETWNTVMSSRIANRKEPLSIGRVYSNSVIHASNVPHGASITPNRTPLHMLAIYTHHMPDSCADPDGRPPAVSDRSPQRAISKRTSRDLKRHGRLFSHR